MRKYIIPLNLIILCLISFVFSCEILENDSIVEVEYIIQYMGNMEDSGNVPIDENSYHNGDIIVVKSNEGYLSRSGYTFSGWNTVADGTGSSYESGDQITITDSNVLLYAYWVISPIDNTGTDNTGTDNTGTDNTGTDNTGTDNTGTDNTGTDNNLERKPLVATFYNSNDNITHTYQYIYSDRDVLLDTTDHYEVVEVLSNGNIKHDNYVDRRHSSYTIFEDLEDGTTKATKYNLNGTVKDYYIVTYNELHQMARIEFYGINYDDTVYTYNNENQLIRVDTHYQYMLCEALPDGSEKRDVYMNSSGSFQYYYIVTFL